MPFDFAFQVNDDEGNDFAHGAQSDGEVVEGEYRVALPDGRTQIVTYRADPVNGYTAEVTYEGEAHFPEVEPYEPPRTPQRGYLAPSK
ncbi:cuticle protein 19.8-like [Oratosquilla oratoria]|uniref:cuticle protein 19.8-like n=1 Tax=Oratosquilla oratoria TaxID=337810 RepID=UPI003F776228